jgi:hypothetical protein
MTVNTAPRDYDIARMLADYQRRIAFLERAILRDPVSASIWQDAPGGFDTGWLAVTNFEPGVTAQAGSNTPQVRRYGPVVMARGRCTTAGVSGAVTFCTLPSGFGLAPVGIWELGAGSTAPTPASRYFVNPSGTLASQGWDLDQTFSLSGVWGVSLP